MTKKIRTTGRHIIAEIANLGKQSVRKLANVIGISKSSAHRHLQAIKRRNLHPESGLWETEAGEAWLRLLFFAVLYKFGLECNIGADRISDFFKLIRINTHVGVSPSALRTQMNKMEELLPIFQGQCENSAGGQKHQIIAAGDETFFGEVLILVLMDLSSGYLMLEEIADDRTFETWFEKAKPRLENLGIEVEHAITDRAKALIKLALDGFDCQSGADLFHAQHDVSKWLGPAFGRRYAKASRQLKDSVTKLETLEEKGAPTSEIHKQRQYVKQDEATCYKLEKGQENYRETLRGVSEVIHPFDGEDNTPHNSATVEKSLEQKAKAFEEIARTHSIEDTKGVMKKFRKQFKDLSTVVDSWWLWTLESLSGYALSEYQQNWLLQTLLPVIYWHQQMEKTQNHQHRNKYKKAWEKALAVWQVHPLTLSMAADEIEQWSVWAEWIAGKFHRSSSAVEGRNGCLAQMYHNGRGLSAKRLKALTVIHNFGLKRADGTTAAERLFETSFPDLFEWLVEQMGELPLPRRGRQRVHHNPLIPLVVPP